MFVQQQVEKLAMTAVEFPPMQKGASFNLEAVKAQIEAARRAAVKVMQAKANIGAARRSTRAARR